MNLKRYLSVLLALVMVLVLLPVGAAQAESYNLWVNGIQVTTENQGNVLGDASASVQFDNSSGENVLTLTDPILTEAGGKDAVICWTAGAPLVITGEAYIMTNYPGRVGMQSEVGDLTLRSLNLTIQVQGGGSCGINQMDGRDRKSTRLNSSH